LTKEIADESNPDGSRMLAAVIFKNFIANRGGVSLKQAYDLYRTIVMRIIGSLSIMSSGSKSRMLF
jgi:hypothetical protein